MATSAKIELNETAESGVDKVVSSCEKNPSVHKAYTNFLRQRKTALDAPLHAVSLGRYLLPQCALDATGFLSDVYKKGTRAKKFLADDVQCGRSMIEMLGVLAIVGVLSVGGIAGYSKAMMTWRSNVQRNGITELIATLIKIKPNLNAFDEKYNILNSVIAAMGDIPEGFEYKNGCFYDKNGVQIQVMQGRSNWTDQNGNITGHAQRIIIFFSFIEGEANSSLSSVELCKNIIAAAKPVSKEVLMITFWESHSSQWNGYDNTGTFYTQKELEKAEISDITKKCKMTLKENGRQQFLLYLNPY